MTTLVYQTESFNKTPEQAAQEFARTYFDKPRQIKSMAGNEFSLKDGLSKYQVAHVPGGGYEVDVFKIYRIGLV